MKQVKQFFFGHPIIAQLLPMKTYLLFSVQNKRINEGEDFSTMVMLKTIVYISA